VNLLLSGDPDKSGRPLSEQETLAQSLQHLTELLGKAQHYVDDVVVRFSPCDVCVVGGLSVCGSSCVTDCP
jgi:hypothetical protein